MNKLNERAKNGHIIEILAKFLFATHLFKNSRMKNNDYFRVILAAFLFLNITTCFAQEKDSTKIFRLETIDGNGYTGNIIASDSLRVVFRTEKLGEITIPQSEIKSLLPVDVSRVKGGKYWFANPQSTRTFFAPNGYGLKKGEGYYQNVWVLVNSFAVGINDYVSLGGGLIPAFLFAGSPTPVWMTAKVSVPVSKDKFNLGAGALVGTVAGEADTGFGIFYGIATVGSRDANFSLGMGYAVLAEDGSSAPMINISGMLRVSPRGYLITENYIFPNGSDGAVILSFGGRTIIREAGLDYGLIIPMQGEDLYALPWLGITIPFGNNIFEIIQHYPKY
jgi:hypothetical protein